MGNKYSAGQLLEKHLSTLIGQWRGTGNIKPLSRQELIDVSSSLLSLQRGLTGTRKLAGSGYMENRSYLGAYLLYYWPVSYLQISYSASLAATAFRKIAEKKEQMHRSIRILDLGSGPAPASSALLDIFAAYNQQLSIEPTLIDSSKKALDLAKKIINEEFKGTKVNAYTANFENQIISQKQNHSINDTAYGIPGQIRQNRFDIIVVSHALNELWETDINHIEKRKSFLDDVTSLLVPDGLLFLSEPALLETSRDLITLRNKLIFDGWNIIAPCTGNGNCPALTAGRNNTCHAELKWEPPEPVSSIAEKAELDRESVKMTFFIMKKKNEADTNAVEKRKGTITARVVSEGMLNKAGRIRYLLCDGNTRIPFSAKKYNETAQSQRFFKLKRYDLVEIENPEQRGDKANPAYGFGEQTKLKIRSPG